MARKSKNNVDYFPHTVSHGKKMFIIRQEFGNDGYAVWFMLLEKLGSAHNHHLNLSDTLEIMYLSSEFKVDEKSLLRIIDFLVKIGEFNSELWHQKQVLFNEKFVDSISDAYKRRNSKVITLTELMHTFNIKMNTSTQFPNEKNDINPQSNSNTNTKVKVKEEKKSKPETGSPSNSQMDYAEFIRVFNTLCPKMPKPTTINTKRKKMIDARISEHSKQEVLDVLKMAGESDFLNGVNNRNFVANFDWIFNPSNFLKILEGNYTNRIQEQQIIAPTKKAGTITTAELREMSKNLKDQDEQEKRNG